MSDDAIPQQPEMVEIESEPTSAKNMSVADLIQSAQKEAKAAANTRRRSLEHLHDALTITMELYELQDSDPGARSNLAERLEGQGIRSDNRTKNGFVPIAKLIFGEWENAANISRNAAALKYDLDKGIKSGRLVQFFRDQGGIAKCAALEAAARRAAGTK